MSSCIDKKIGALLYAYELGMLSEEDIRAVELHIIECSHCREKARSFVSESNIIKENREFQEFVGKLAAEEPESKSEPAVGRFESKISKKSWSLAIPLAAVILLFLVLTDWEFEIKPEKKARATENLLTILYFTDVQGKSESDILGSIAANLLITDLGESKYLQVTSVTQLQKYLEVIDYDKTQPPDAEFLYEIAEISGSRWLLTGNILQTKPKILITTHITEAATGNILSTQRVDGELNEDIFAIIDRLSIEIKNDLPLPNFAIQESDPAVADITTHSQTAFRHYIQGVEYRNQFYFEKAIEEFKAALEYDSTMAMAYYHLCELEDGELIHKALKFIDKISQREKYHILATHAFRKGNTEEGIEYLQNLLNDYPNDAYAYFRLGQVFNGRAVYNLAIEHYNEAIAINRYYKQAYNALAYLYDYTGDFEKSILTINKYIEIASNEPNPYDTRGDILSNSGQLDKAIESYRMALNIDPEYLFSLEKLAFHYLYRRDYKLADSCFRELSIKDDEVVSMHARFMLISLNLLQGKFAFTTSLIDSLIASNLDKNDSIYAAYHMSIKSQILIKMGQNENAISLLKTAHTFIPSDSINLGLSYQSGFVKSLAEAGQIDQSMIEFKTLKSLYDEAELPIGDFWYTKGFVEFYAKNYDAAIEAFQNNNNKTPGFIERYMIARSFLEMNQYDKCAELFEQLLVDYGTERLRYALYSVEMHYYLGRTYEESHWYNKAIENYKEFLSFWGNADISLEIVSDARERLKILEQNP